MNPTPEGKKTAPARMAARQFPTLGKNRETPARQAENAAFALFRPQYFFEEFP